jgi:sec-independent protein translocase protein TatA
MPWGLTPAHLIVILVIVLIVVGPGKLPDTGAALGKALRGFKEAMEGTEPSQSSTQSQTQQPSVPMQQNVMAQPPVQPQYQQPVPQQPVPQQPVQYQQAAPQQVVAPAQAPYAAVPVQGQTLPPAAPVDPSAQGQAMPASGTTQEPPRQG